LEGKAGAWFRSSFDLLQAPDATLESSCAEAGLENGLVPFRIGGCDVEWLQTPIYARPLGYSWMKPVWPNHFDAIVFNKTMQPSTRK
jgi:hypothetical protein